MSLIRELAEIDRAARAQGSSLAQVLAFAARAGAGVDVYLRRPLADAILDPSDADSLEELQENMTKLAAAVAALTLEAQEQRTQLQGIVAYVQGVPNLVAAAVADALKGVGVDDEAAAAAIDAARTSISDATDAALRAIDANTNTGTPLVDPIGTPLATEPVAEDAVLAPENTPPVVAEAATPAADAAPTGDTPTG